MCACLNLLRTRNVGELTRRRGTGVPAPKISPRNPRNAFTATLDARASLSGQGIAPYFLGVSQGIAGYRGVSRGIAHLGWGGQSLSDSRCESVHATHPAKCAQGHRAGRVVPFINLKRTYFYKIKKNSGNFHLLFYFFLYTYRNICVRSALLH